MTMHGNKTYIIEYLPSVIKKDISSLSSDIKKLIKKAIETKLVIDPIKFGKPLSYSLKGHRRLRVGDYRIVYRITPELNTVTIIAIKHRKDVYES